MMRIWTTGDSAKKYQAFIDECVKALFVGVDSTPKTRNNSRPQVQPLCLNMIEMAM